MTPGIRVAASVLALVFLSVGVADSQAGFSTLQRKCRETVAKRGEKLSETVAKTLSTCHKKRGNGQIAASVDCRTVLEADPPKGKIAKAAAKLSGQLASKCAGNIPADLLFLGCPFPCDTTVPAIVTMQDVADCLSCVVEDVGEAMSANAQSLPVVPLPPVETACHAAIGKNQTKHFKTILKERVKCQKASEKAGAMDTSACALGDPKGKIQRARDKAAGKIGDACAAAQLGFVESCSPNNLSALISCVLGDSDARGEQVFEALYGLQAGGGPTTTMGTTTTMVTTTTTSTTTTTITVAQDPLCPSRGELILFAGTTGVACASDLDCVVGSCDLGLGRCVTTTRLDTGYTGIAHGSDINDQVLTVGTLICPGPFDALNAEPCGDCTVAGLNPDPGYCRCQGDNRTVCDQPFAVDNVNCGGGICDCFFGAPLPLSSGNTPVCVVNRFFDDISGTANVDLGSGSITANLRSLAHLGENLVLPCPACGGSCTAGKVGNGCATDLDCDTGLTSGTFNNDGTCSNFDAVANDGLRGGTCFKGLNDGQSCDIGAFHESFPAPGGSGAGLSLDCFPDPGKNVSGTGLKITLSQTTGTASLPLAGVKCGFPIFAESLCPCGQCSTGLPSPNDFTVDTCTSNADCAGIGNETCANPDGAVFPNNCTNGLCSDIGGRGECSIGPDDGFCDGILLSDGSGFLACNNDADCTPAIIGLPGGTCTLTTRRSCFLDPISATGTADPATPIGVAAFCIGRTGNAGINAVAGLPGPGRVTNAAAATTFCTDGVTAYTPGVGGCP